MEHWDGTQWSIIPSPDGPTGDGGLNGISGTSSNDIWVVGEHDNASYYAMAKAMTMHWDGTAWSVVIPPNPSPWGVSPLNSVLARAPNDVYAVGQWENPTQGLSTFVVHWDGTAWTQVSSEDTPGSGTGSNLLYEITQDPSGGLWTSGAKQASFGDLTFSLVERASTAAMTDTVSVTQATYQTARKKLQISATTTATDATLTAYVTSSDTLIGTLDQAGQPLRREIQLAHQPGEYHGQKQRRRDGEQGGRGAMNRMRLPHRRRAPYGPSAATGCSRR